MSNLIEFKKGREIDWLELNLLRTGEGISKSLITTLANDYFDESDLEREVDGWLRELEHRNSLYSKPFYKVENNKIIPLVTWQEIPEYYLCVYYSFFGASDNTNGTKLFEKISAQSLKNFIDGIVYTLGFPEGKGLNDYLDEFVGLCFEKRGILANSDYKDDGVDVIGLKLFNDNRGANIYVLLQCAAGVHWKQKDPINIGRWNKYILWYQECIVSSISTVNYVDKRSWEKQSSKFGMLIDRVRIYNSLYKYDVEHALRAETISWAEQTINGVL